MLLLFHQSKRASGAVSMSRGRFPPGQSRGGDFFRQARPDVKRSGYDYKGSWHGAWATGWDEQICVFGGFGGYGQPLWLRHTGQAQGQPAHRVSTP